MRYIPDSRLTIEPGDFRRGAAMLSHYMQESMQGVIAILEDSESETRIAETQIAVLHIAAHIIEDSGNMPEALETLNEWASRAAGKEHGANEMGEDQ